MHESIHGRRYLERIRGAIFEGDLARSVNVPTHVAVLRASNRDFAISHCSDAGMLWLRLSLAVKLLAEEGWDHIEQWSTALGVDDEYPDPTDDFPSIAQSLIDLSHVVADRKQKNVPPMERDHRMLLRASIGVVDQLCWEWGDTTDKGKWVNGFYPGFIFSEKTREAS